MGVYVHVPFCRSKCFYCGFYSVVNEKLKADYLKSVCKEIELRQGYLQEPVSRSLYLGGGTPSYLDLVDIEQIVVCLEKYFRFDSQAERTIEMNPEDAGLEKLKGLRGLGFNRLSIGVQSFNDGILKRIHRTHSARMAIQAVENARKVGFANIGVDLIIGLPGSDRNELLRDLDVVKQLDLEHISVYILSIDSNSVFQKLSKNGKLKTLEDDLLADLYLMTAYELEKMGFEHYEISNFAKKSKYSIHNTSYWQQKEYIGLGPAAHSYNLLSRQWNIAKLKSYIDSLSKGELNIEKEELTNEDRYNEFLMTGLRTCWGIDIGALNREFAAYWKQSLPLAEAYVQNGYAGLVEGRFTLTKKGWLISDRIFSDLFV